MRAIMALSPLPPPPAVASSRLQSAHYESFGVPFTLQTDSPSLHKAFPAHLPHASTHRATPAPDTFILLSNPLRLLHNQALIAQAATEPELLNQLASTLMVHVANLAPHHVFVHAGVVAHGGRVLLLPGPSHAGKTTLVHALVRAGATYYSDEYAVLDPSGLVHPYARALQIRLPGQREQYSQPAPGPSGTVALRAGQVHFITHSLGAIFHPTRVTPGRAVLELLRHTIPVQRTPGRVMSALAAMLANASAWQSPRGEADLTTQALLAFMEATP